MGNSNSQTSKGVWEIAEQFCRRIIVLEGVIQSISAVCCSDLLLRRLWISSGIELICPGRTFGSSNFRTVVFERGLQLLRIEAPGFLATGLKAIAVPASVEVLGIACFRCCRSLSSVTFESSSRLSQIEMGAFFETGLKAIVLPASVEVLGAAYFSHCLSLSSVTFESRSRLSRIEEYAFFETRLDAIVIPASVEFIGDECFAFCPLESITFEQNSRLRHVGRDNWFNSPISPGTCDVF
jgi:hypothetical protein